MNPKVALQIRNSEPLETAVETMAQAGFRYVSMAFGDPRPLLGTDWRRYVSEIGELFDRHGLVCIQTHAPYYGLLLSAEVRDPNMEKALLRTIEATSMLGAEICAVHPRSVILPGEPRETAVDRERSLCENVAAFTPLAELCEKWDVLLGIENLMKYPHEHPYFYSYLAEDHAVLIDALKSEHVKAIWDFGHANLVDADQAERIRTLGSRIKGTHVHNNGGREDEHFPPFLPTHGEYYVHHAVDWQSVMQAMQSIGYDGYLTLESVFDFKYAPLPYVRYLYESVCLLDRMLGRS